MGIKPAKASILYKEEVLKASSIQIVALLCIFLRSSDDILSEHVCSTTTENYIGQSVRCKTYREVVSGKG